MTRSWRGRVAFGVCLAAVLTAMGWVSLTAVRLQRAQAEAHHQAALEEDVRLALWRMDSALAPLIAEETARPYFDYSAFHPAERAYTRMFTQIDRGEVQMPSPLLAQASPYVRLHFQLDPAGALTSPQAPTGNMRDLAEALYTTQEAVEAAGRRLAQLQTLVTRDALLSALPERAPPPPPPTRIPETRLGKSPLDQEEQRARSALEWQARAQSFSESNLALQQRAAPPLRSRPGDVSVGAMTPLWMRDELLLVRRVSVSGTLYVQGCWLDWPALRDLLLSSVQDLLPGASLEPVGGAPVDVPVRRLAALPVRVAPGATLGDEPGWSFPGWLLILWGVTLAAATGAALLVGGIVSLSERRAAFVSAVTHELRTPLTTLRMYAEMLTEGMIPEEEARRSYLHTLLAEADRLGHLVENVLAYAQLERGRPGDRAEPVPLADLLDRVTDRLRVRAQHAQMDLVVEAGNDALPVTVQVDPSAVEQILFNLVDNACKYAADAEDRLIRLQALRDGDVVLLRVRDHGPGITRRQARRLFRPFSKSAREAASSAPGVGLGLALSRRLARSMGARLHLDENVKDGACFVLRLPTQ